MACSLALVVMTTVSAPNYFVDELVPTKQAIKHYSEIMGSVPIAVKV